MNEHHWRLIITPPESGAWNMAVDEAILESVNSNSCLPTLRLFSWNPYCLSLGHAQQISEINLDYLKRSGWGLVRRPTGGRAILHADELTYSVCAPLHDPHVSGGVVESYRKISACLLKALEYLEIKADSLPKNNEEKYLSKDPVCFQYPSDYEITYQGKKLIGSAQARRSNALLQHGAIPLFGDITRIVSALKFNSESDLHIAANRLSKRATTLKAASGKEILWQDLSNALVKAFKNVFSIEFMSQSLNPREITASKKLFEEKYNNSIWTNRI